MKKGRITMMIVMLMLLTVVLYFISGTYARYADSRSGKTTVSVAKWQVAITDGTDALENNFTLPFTVEENDNVVEGKIAPATKATATIELDLTGTEVAVDFGAVVTDTALATLFGASSDKVKLSTEVKGATESATSNADGTTTIALPNGQAFSGENGKITITITLTWENDDTFNTSDTAVGTTAGTLEIPVELTLEQHIEADTHA